VPDQPVPAAQQRTKQTGATVFVALGANIAIALAKVIGGVISGSPALFSEAAHSVADSFNELFLLVSLRRGHRPPDDMHPFGYGKERFFWSLMAAVGIFVMGGCFSFYQGIRAWRPEPESSLGFKVALGVLAVSMAAESSSLAKALIERRRRQRELGGPAGLAGQDPALRTVLAEDSTAVLGVVLAMIGVVLHWVTGNSRWEAAASLGIGVLLVCVAAALAFQAQRELIGQAVDPGLREELRGFLDRQPEIDAVLDLLTMRLGPDSTLLAVRIDLRAGIDSEDVELVCMRIKGELSERWPGLDHVFLDITDAPTERRSRR
jgi:cation diffusion facilitator family transporter